MIIHKNFPQNILLIDITNQMSKEDQVKFALFCAKDCFHLNNEETKSKAQTCIDLLEKWLNSNKKQRKSLQPKLTKADASAYSASSSAYSASSSAYSAANAASYAFANQSGNNNPEIRNQKLQEYKNLAKSLLSTTSFQHTQQSKSFLSKDTNPDSISALIDYLLDNQENIVLFQNDKVILNYVSQVEANFLSELIETIHEDKSLTFYLKRLYS